MTSPTTFLKNKAEAIQVMGQTAQRMDATLADMRFKFSLLESMDEEILAYKVKSYVQSIQTPFAELHFLKENLSFLCELSVKKKPPKWGGGIRLDYG